MITLEKDKKVKSTGIVSSKRTTWNTKRKYNYKYVTSVF